MSKLQWPTAIAVYYNGPHPNNVTIICNTDGTIDIGDDIETLKVTFANRNLSDVVADFNAGLTLFDIKQVIDLGSEKLKVSSLVFSVMTSDKNLDGSYSILYRGHLIKYEDNLSIRLRAPDSVSPFESWYPKITNGRFNVRFSDITFTSFPGVNPNATYTFAINEFKNQEWSVLYGPPYKDSFGERAQVLKYNPITSSTIVKVAHKPVYLEKNNISVIIKGIRQNNNIIKYIDSNNGLIYLGIKVSSDTPIYIDYTYKEDSYVYDGIDLNPAIGHNPSIIGSYVAFYIKPISSQGALISGGNCIFHEILNTEVGGQHKIARIIPSTANSANPIYEPVIYLGSISLRESIDIKDVSVIDTRTVGGGLKADKTKTYKDQWKDTNFFLDIGSFDGISIPGNSAISITVPESVINKGMTKEEVNTKINKAIPLGTYVSINTKE